MKHLSLESRYERPPICQELPLYRLVAITGFFSPHISPRDILHISAISSEGQSRDGNYQNSFLSSTWILDFAEPKAVMYNHSFRPLPRRKETWSWPWCWRWCRTNAREHLEHSCVPALFLSALRGFPHFMFTAPLWKWCCYSHWQIRRVEYREVNKLASKWGSQVAYPLELHLWSLHLLMKIIIRAIQSSPNFHLSKCCPSWIKLWFPISSCQRGCCGLASCRARHSSEDWLGAQKKSGSRTPS